MMDFNSQFDDIMQGHSSLQPPPSTTPKRKKRAQPDSSTQIDLFEKELGIRRPRRRREVDCEGGLHEQYPVRDKRKGKAATQKNDSRSKSNSMQSQLEPEVDAVPSLSLFDTEIPQCSRQTMYEASDKEWSKVRDTLFPVFNEQYLKPSYTTIKELYGSQLNPCQACSQSTIEQSTGTVYSTEGGYNVEVNRVRLCSCGIVDETKLFLHEGLWPLTLTTNIFLTFGLMDMMSQLMNTSPSLSYHSICKAVNDLVKRKSPKIKELRPNSFACSMREFRRMEFRSLCEVYPPFTCPCCRDRPFAVHLDGNAKLYRYKNAGESSTIGAISTGFIDSNERVEQFVNAVRASSTNKTQRLCGDTSWKAAKAGRGGKSSKIDQTGLEIATCRHVFLLKAINMSQGEIFAYPYYLQMQFPGAQFICMDVICKYWPWLRKQNLPLSKEQQPLLSVMHAKAHEFKCQVTWNGRWRDGAGLSTGETTELANAYISRLGLTTKHMHAAMREERITQAAAYWNRKKLLDLPEVLSKQFKRALDRHRKASLLLANHLNNDDLSESQLLTFISDIQGSEIGDSDRSVEQKMSAGSCLRQRVVAQLAKCTSAKRRPKLMKKLEKSTKRLKEYLASYLQETHDSDGEQLLTALLNNHSHIFPWTQQQVLGVTEESFSRFLDAAETYQLVHRCKEELAILRNEASSFNKTIDEELSHSTPHSRKFLTFNDLKRRMTLTLMECDLVSPSTPTAPNNWDSSSSDCGSDTENDSDSDSVSSSSSQD